MNAPTVNTPAPTHGRTPDFATSRWLRKHGAILDAATELFLSEGYLRTSMEAIADRAGVSKATLYTHFGNKAGLFEAIVDGLCHQLFEPVRRSTEQPASPREVLLALARQYMQLMLEPSSIGLFRALVSEEEVRSELGARSYGAGAGAALAELAAYLEDWTNDGLLSVDDCGLAAEQFFGMLGGIAQVRALLGVCEQISETALSRMTEGAVTTFLRAFAAAPGVSRSPD
jgi:TetR/AcrR family transcriptional repressor of mexJK operon